MSGIVRANNSGQSGIASNIETIDSDDYVDDSIDTAHIAVNQVTLAEMAGITRGSIIYGDASGDPAALAKGTEDYVLTAGADDVAWAAAGGVTLSGSTDNTIATVTGSNALAGEANLTYSTDLSITSGNVVIATAGKGIDFSAQTATTSGSTDAELLDHYEEGTFTPLFSDSSGGVGSGQTYNYQFGKYVKIGRMCWINIRINFNDNNGGLSGNVYIKGLPFTSLNLTNDVQALAVGNGSGWAVPTAGYNGAAHIEYNKTLIFLHLWDGTLGTSGLQFSELSSDGGLTVSGCYMATA